MKRAATWERQGELKRALQTGGEIDWDKYAGIKRKKLKPKARAKIVIHSK